MCFVISRSGTSTNSKDEVFCDNSLQLRVVAVLNTVISSSILGVGRGPATVSYKYGILSKFLQVSHFTEAALKNFLKILVVTLFGKKTCFKKWTFVEIKLGHWKDTNKKTTTAVQNDTSELL